MGAKIPGENPSDRNLLQGFFVNSLKIRKKTKFTSVYYTSSVIRHPVESDVKKKNWKIDEVLTLQNILAHACKRLSSYY